MELPQDWKNIFADNVEGLKVKGNEAYGLCPFHEDRTASFYINRTTSQWICHAGCGEGNFWKFKKMLADPSLVRPELPQTSQSVEKEPRILVQTYTYKDESGIPQFEVKRYNPKTFTQNKIGGHNMEGVEKFPYQLDKLAASPDSILFWVEGEKDADTLNNFGVLASTSPGGANSWQDSYANKVPNKFIVLIPDNDPAGKIYAKAVTDSFNRRQKIVLEWEPKEKDATDFLKANPQISVGELKNKIWRQGIFSIATKGPIKYFEERGIEIQPWAEMNGNRLEFLKRQLKAAQTNLTDLLDPHHLKILEWIDFNIGQIRDSESYLAFCCVLTHLEIVREFYEKLY
jgi:CHC2 zinc finger